MSKVAVYNLTGESAGDMELDASVFGVELNSGLVQLVARAQRANAHIPVAHTKGRAEVRGGGKKPWRQKGTGRARHGSSRSPLWRGGGVTFGPTKERNMSLKINKKSKRAALRMMLTDKAAEKRLIVIDSFDGVDGKTKQISTLLEKVAENRPSVIASGVKNDSLRRAAGNLARVNTMLADSLNVGDLLKYRYLIIDKAGIEQVTELLKK